MSCFKFAFPIYDAQFENADIKFNIADVTFACISNPFSNQELNELIIDNEKKVFAIVNEYGKQEYAENRAFQKCSLAVDIFKICSDLYHSNYFNPKKWQFDIDCNFIRNGKSYVLVKELREENDGLYGFTFRANRFPTLIDRKVISSLDNWHIKDFEEFFEDYFKPEKQPNLFKSIRRAIRLYSLSFSITNLHERLVALCSCIDTICTNEREGKVPQIITNVTNILRLNEGSAKHFENFMRRMYSIRSEYIHNAGELLLDDSDIDKLEKIIFRIIHQFVIIRNDFKSCKEYCHSLSTNNKSEPKLYPKYYRHFKGGKYKALMEGKDSETQEPVVIYQALYGEHDIWVRPKAMFYENVEREGYKGPRFTEITEEEALK